MKNFLKMAGVLLPITLASSMVLVACGDDSSSSGVFSMEKSFEIVTSKAKYTYNKKDSTLKQILPVCKEGTLGNLVGPKDADEWDTVTYRAYESKGVVSLKKGKDEEIKYSLENGSFPRGFWADPDYDTQKIQKGLRFEKKDLFKSVIRYDGSCLMKDYYSVFLKGNPALENMDEKLTAFYQSFLGDKTVEDAQMLSDMRAADCDELTLFDGFVRLSLVDFKESSGKIRIKYSKRTCDVSFQYRYAYEQKDCEAAYEEYKNEKPEEAFDFADYAFDVTEDEYCIRRLIIDLQEDKGIHSQKSSRDFARDVVKLVVGSLE